MSKYKFKDDKKKIVVETETKEVTISMDELDRDIAHREKNIVEAQEKLDGLIAKREAIKEELDFTEEEAEEEE